MKLECEAKRELAGVIQRIREKRHQAERRLKGYHVKEAKAMADPHGSSSVAFLRGSIMEIEFQLQDLNIIELHLSELEI